MERTQINLEYIFRASPAMLYKFFTEPANIIRWFCDEVDISGSTYTFMWSGSEEAAQMIESEEDERIRFRWEETEDENEYFEYKMYKSPLTGETILEITDFCDEDEIDDQKQVWEEQIESLRRATGS